MSIFRTATKQAIREIIEENGFNGRFGHILSNNNIETVTDKVVDLFEMTLTLRSHTSAMFGGGNATQEPPPPSTRRTPEPTPVGFPKTRNAAEIYDSSMGTPRNIAPEALPANAETSLQLRRKRN